MDPLSGRQEIAQELGITAEQLRALQEHENDETFETNEQVTRIVLVGKTGNGKSTTGNVILGGNYFQAKFSPISLTVNCSKAKAVVDGQMVAIIDTPGLFDTRYGLGQTTQDIRQCIGYSSPGPHIFLVVIRLGRFTDEERQSVQKIQEIFGPAANKYSMVLFTHGDQLEGSFEDFFRESKELQDLVSRCNGQYQVFNNKSKDRSQVTELLQKIRTIVLRNGGHHYTNRMYQEAEKAIEMQKQKILAAKAEKIRQEREQIKREIESQFKMELERMDAQMKAEQERERKRMNDEMNKEKAMVQEMREEQDRQRALDLKKMEEARKMLEEQMNKEMSEKMQELAKQYEEQARNEAESCNFVFVKLIEAIKRIFLR